MSRQTFSKTPHWLLAKVAAGDLTPNALVTFAALGKYANRRGTGVWPSNRTLQADTGFSERTVRDHLRLLESVGAIETVARHGTGGRQTSNLVLLHFDEPEEPMPASPGSQPPPPADADTGSQPPPPPGSQPPPYEPDTERTTPSSPDPVVEVPPTDSTTQPTSGPIEPDSPPVPSSGPPATLPVVRRRQLTNAGVTPEQGPLWEQAWTTVTSMQWPAGLEMEAAQYPDEHLAQHVFQTLERGYALSPSRWVQFYISDRQTQIIHALGRLEQEARMREDPAEREARQNRALPPDRSREFTPPTTTQDGVQP